MKSTNLPLRKTKCGTCPFKADSPYEYLAKAIAESAKTESHICHSTGSNDINRRTGIAPHLCRGARDIQLDLMEKLGVITEATDESWNYTRVLIGMRPTVVQDPPMNLKI